ncbi:MAG: penicillin-binding protein 2 [Elusimicrobia bacterium]|nr:penicillin-binding protein 2 [Elusimicrobiota bacterium]
MLWFFIYMGGAILGARLFQLQIIQNVEYQRAAERNRSQIIYKTAPRGRLYDRKGAVLATNRPAFSLIYLPPGRGQERSDLKSLASALSQQLHKDPDDLLENLEQAVREETAIRLAENLPMETMFRLSELKTVYPGVELIVEARRYYPFGRFASHLVGYMGKMDQRSWKDLKNKGYRIDSRVGKMGVERMFEAELRGQDGGIRMEVDAQGRLKRILEKISWEPGSNITLTLDAAMQKAADEGLRKSPTGRGAVVALDPSTGAILALASSPDFDPNALLSTNPQEVKRTIEDLPEFNHAIAGVYPPGSAFKLVVGAAGLNEGKFSTRETVFCPGYFELGRRIFLCWDHKGHKTVSWSMGLARSCNIYFNRMGLKTGGEAIERYSKLFGFGAKTNIALPGERSGHLFGPEARALSRHPWYDGDTVNLSIGQGELLVTPIQLAVFAAALANRGTLWRPYYTARISYADGQPDYVTKPERLGAVALKESVWRDLHEAMQLVVSSGTARGTGISGLDILGKTGTAQNPGGNDHAWFIAFAGPQGQTPGVALAVLVENGGHGASVAAPIARNIFLAAYGDKPQPPGGAAHAN